MDKPKRAQRNCLRVLQRQCSQVSYICATLNCNQDEWSDKTTEFEHCSAQSSTADHKLLVAITDDAEYDQVFDQCQNTQKAA